MKREQTKEKIIVEAVMCGLLLASTLFILYLLHKLL